MTRMIYLTSQLSGKRLLTLTLVAVSIVSLIALFVRPGTTSAANFSQSYVRYDRMKISTATNVLVVFTVPASNVLTEAKLLLTWPAGFTIAGVPTVNTTGLPGGVTALPGTLTAAGASQVITISGVTNLTASTQYGVNIATGVTTHATPGQYLVDIATQTGASAAIDNAQVATRIISDDQIVITATVPPTFNFTLSGNTDAFTTSLDVASVVSTTGKTVTLATNAANGWIVWAKDLNAGLTSAAAGNTIPTTGSIDATPSTLSIGTPGYVLDTNLTSDSATAGTGTVTIAAEYNGLTTSAGGTLSSSAYQPLASANGPTDADVITLIERAAISALTDAATDYTDTLTVVGAGNF